MIVLAGYLFVTYVIDLRYQGDAPAVAVSVEGFAPDAIATEGIAVSPSGDVFVATGTGQILRLLPDGGTDVFVDLAGLKPGAKRDAICQIAFAHNGDLYVAHYAHGALRLVKPDGTVSTLDDNLAGPNFVLWHPAGYVFLTDSDGQVLYRYDPDGGNRTVIVEKDAVTYPNGFAWTGAGDGLLLNSTSTGTIYHVALTPDLRAAGAPRQVAFYGSGYWKKPVLDGLLRIGPDDYLTCDFFGNELLRINAAGVVRERYLLGEALNGAPIHPASLAQGRDGAIYVSNLGHVFKAMVSPEHWGRGFYRIHLPDA